MNERKVVTDNQFHQLAKEKPDQTSNVGVRKQYAADDVKAIDEKQRQIKFVISTESIDRYGDSIDTKGWNLENYLQNPVVLFAHDNGQIPPARCVDITKRPKKKQLEATAEFAPQEVNQFSETLFQLYNRGFMRATSVGFLPKKFEFACDDDETKGDSDRDPLGINFKQQELLEFSLVPVPANPDALMSAKSQNVDLAPLKEWAEKVLDNWGEYKDSGFFVPRRQVETMHKKVDGGTQVTINIPDNLTKDTEESVEETSEVSTEEKSVEEDETYVPKHIEKEYEQSVDNSVESTDNEDEEKEYETQTEEVEVEVSEDEIKTMIREALQGEQGTNIIKEVLQEQNDVLEETDHSTENEQEDQLESELSAEQEESVETEEREVETVEHSADHVKGETLKNGEQFLDGLDDLLSQRDSGTFEFDRKQLRLLKNIRESLADALDEVEDTEQEEANKAVSHSNENSDPLDQLAEALSKMENAVQNV